MLAVVTKNVRFFFDCANELKKRGVPFLTIPLDSEIPSNVNVILTTNEEAPLIDFTNVAHDADPIPAVIKALASVKNRDYCKQIIVGIDPGPKPGVAVLGDGIILEAFRVDNINDIAKRINSVLESLDAENYIIKIGHQDETNRNRIINLLWPIGITINIVKEHHTTVNSHQPNIDAAKSIARLKGTTLDWPPAVAPTLGELKEIQRQSRIHSNGEMTIPIELARRVAKGELSMDDALAWISKSESTSKG